MLDLYKNIKKYRLENKMSQAELAKLAGYTDRSSIAKIENGDVDLPQSKILLLAKALGVDPGALMGNTGLSVRELSPDESALLDDYQKLNDIGKDKAREYVSDLSDNRKYTRSGEKSLLSDAG